MKSSVIICFLIIVLIINVTAKTGPAHNKVVVCYLAAWAVYRVEKGSYSIENFDPNLCTHVIYAFSGLDNLTNSIKSLDPFQDLKDDYGKDGYARLNNLKITNPHLKVSLAIGGWNEGSINYSNMAADPNKRKSFVTKASQFIQKHNFDGLDLDWEYPSLRGGRPEDKTNFVQLVKELRIELNKNNLLLTSAFGASKKTIDQAYDIKALAKLFDFMHIMCYDYGGSWDRKIGTNAPLTDSTELNIETTIDYLINLGAPPSKLVLGIPFYGRTFITDGPGNLGDPSDESGFKGPYTRENGFMGYNEVCESIDNKTYKWTTSWDGQSSQAIMKYKDPVSGKTQVVTYDSTRSVANKMRYAVRQQLAGAMIWSVDTDDFLGECTHPTDTYDDFISKPGVSLTIPKRVFNNYPLLRTINDAIVLSYDELVQEMEIKEKEDEENRNRIPTKIPDDSENEIPHGDDKSGSVKFFSSKILLTIFTTFFTFKINLL